MIWAFADPLRFVAEKQSVAELEAKAPWLTVRSWRLAATGVEVEFDIALRDRVFDGALRYPGSFPSVPPSLYSRKKRRWSNHQYGTGGELCLEWGPDNWTPNVTGAMMIESAHRLLTGEEPRDGEIAPEVPTRHELTAGQELRFETRRFVSTIPLEERLATLDQPLPATFALRFRDKAWLVTLTTLDGDGGWHDPSVPEAIAAASIKVTGFVVPVDGRPAGLTDGAAEVRRALVCAAVPEGADWEVLLCREPSGDLHAAALIHSSNIALELAVVRAEPRRRLEVGYNALRGRAVGLVGCGSLGSKIAVSLARAGIGTFLLVDDDVLRPGNLVRHDLDWTHVGRHKVDALADRLKLVDSSVVAVPRPLRLGGQESSGSVDGTVERLAGCDLVIDATADGRVFNYVAAAATHGNRAMLWAEVFGGGFGGLVARSRPDRDPAPHDARSIIEKWCAGQSVTPPRPERDYAASDRGATMIADDAAVSVIAAHAAGMAIDILLPRQPSRYPHSAYMIGMDCAWVFREPFDVCPIDLGPPTPARPPVDLTDPVVAAALAKLGTLVE